MDTIFVANTTQLGPYDQQIRDTDLMVVNAPRPLAGLLTWSGEFRHGIFYAAGARGHYAGQWETADAVEVQWATAARCRELLADRIRTDGYDPAQVLADPAACGFRSAGELAREYGLPWPIEDQQEPSEPANADSGSGEQANRPRGL